MAATTETVATASTRTLTLLTPFSPDGQARIRISEAKGRKVVVTDYNVVAFRCDFGIGMQWQNLRRGKTHNTNLDGKASFCDCEHGTYKPGLKPCRHIAAGLKLLAEGKVQVPQTEDVEF
jgi:hypothetical protein